MKVIALTTTYQASALQEADAIVPALKDVTVSVSDGGLIVDLNESD